jgi:hypothetical protein
LTLQVSEEKQMSYHVYKKSKNAPIEKDFILHGSFNSEELAKKAQADLKAAGFRTRRNYTRNSYRLVKR